MGAGSHDLYARWSGRAAAALAVANGADEHAVDHCLEMEGAAEASTLHWRSSRYSSSRRSVTPWTASIVLGGAKDHAENSF